MAGFSLTFSWLTPELEELWCRPAYSPGFRKGQKTFSEVVEESESKADIMALVKTATKESVGCTKTLSKIFELISETVTQKKDELGLLDAIAGDGDHGISMVRGSAAAQSAIEIAVSENLGAGSALSAAANDWSDRAGGTSGVLWGIILQQLANAVGDSEIPTLATIALGISKSVREVMNVGKAQVGDKTLVDVLVPFSDSLNSSADANKSLIDAWITASEIALEAANNTSRLLPKIGRARTHGEKSLGHPDPGSISFAYICNAVGLILKKECRVH
jgi:dihydroxyacetone kinase